MTGLSYSSLTSMRAEDFEQVRLDGWPSRQSLMQAVERELQLPEGCVAQIAREHGINDNLQFNWRNLHRQGLLDPANRATLIPVAMEPVVPPPRQNGVVSTDISPVISCRLTLPGGSLNLTGPLIPELLRVLISELRDGES